MKKFCFYIVIILLFTGCLIGDRVYHGMSTSYVCAYCKYNNTDTFSIEMGYEDNPRFYLIFRSFDASSMISEGAEYDEYMDLCRKHSDLNYVRKVRWMAGSFFGYEYFDIDPVAIDVVSDADFDELHPAGTSLGDLFYFNSLTPYPFIKNGYSGEELTLICKRLNELTAEEMVLSMHLGGLVDNCADWNENYPNGTPDPFLSLPLESRPTAEQVHTLTVTIKDDYERTFTGKITVDFSQIETAD